MYLCCSTQKTLVSVIPSMLCLQENSSWFVELFSVKQVLRLLLAAQTATRRPLLDSLYHAAAVEVPVFSGE